MRPLSASVKSQLEAWTTAYEANLDQAAEYLKGRGFDRGIGVRFRLGVTDQTSEHPVGMLWIPNLSANGVVGAKMRCLQSHDCRPEGHPKYLGLPGLPARLWHTRAVVEADDTIHVTEGELDAITLEMCGLHAVAVPGAQAWQQHHSRVFAGFRVVYVWPDRDEAGSGLWKRVSDSLPNSQRVSVRAGKAKDVNELFLAEGQEGVMEAMHANAT